MRFYSSILLIVFFLLISCGVNAQEMKLKGKVLSVDSKQPIDLVSISFNHSDIIIYTTEDGSFEVVAPEKSDTMVVTNFGYETQKIAFREINHPRRIEILLRKSDDSMFDAVTIKSKGDPPAIRIIKSVIKNKPENDKDKISEYQYKVYTKTQMDLAGLSDKFKERGFVKKMGVVIDYIDSTEDGEKFLPIVLSETVSDFYYKKNPQKTKEIIRASRMAGNENFEINHLYGDVFLDVNFYDNYIDMFQRSFVSPISTYGRSFYNYLLLDSAYIDNQFCYLLSFQPKRSGGTTFEGQMWIHDTTYALKEIDAKLSSTANINFLHGVDIHQEFQQLSKDVWMMENERLKLRLSATQSGKLLKFIATKTSHRSDFVLNKELPSSFYEKGSEIEYAENSKNSDKALWDSLRPMELSNKEDGIYAMVDSLNKNPFWRGLHNLAEFFASGYVPVGYVEIGDLFNFVRTNPVEKVGFSLSLRTSNKFSKIVEVGGVIGYGIRNHYINWGTRVRVRVNPLRKWGILNFYAGTEIQQYGRSPDLGSAFSSMLKRAPFDKMFYEDLISASYTQDVGRNFTLVFTSEMKQLTSVGLAKFERYNALGEIHDIGKLKTTEFGLELNWGIKRQYFTAVYERTYIGSQYPILYAKVLVGVKGILGSQNNYQKGEIGLDHIVNVGVLGRMRYGVSAGKYFGEVPYPFLNIHEGGETYWLSRKSFNKVGYFEFISDGYVTAFIENHFQGLLFNRIPLIKKLKWRLVANARAAWGMRSPKQNDVLLIPDWTRDFGKVPYVELGIGIENIFKFFRVDMVYRATHQIPGTSPFGVRFRLNLTI